MASGGRIELLYCLITALITALIVMQPPVFMLGKEEMAV
jgi:hypothetical protein